MVEGDSRILSGEPRRRQWSAADILLAGSLSLIAVVVGVFVLLCIQGYETTLANAKAKAMRAAEAVAEGSGWTIAATMASLDAAERKLAEGAIGEAVLTEFDRAASFLPVSPSLGLYRRDGSLVWKSSEDFGPMKFAPASGAAAPSEATALLQYMPDMPSRFGVSQVVELSGEPGILVATLPGAVLSRFAVPHELGDGSTVSVVGQDGWVVARDPPLATPVNLGNTSAWVNLSKADEGAYVSDASPVDGVSRLVGFKKAEGGYIAIASISTDVVFAGLWRSIWIVSLLLAPFAVAILIGSILTANVLRRSELDRRSLSAALEQNRQLFKEIHHRVKNNLQSVAALLQVHAIPPEVRADLSARLFAMSAVHEHIYRTENFADVAIKGYLHSLINKVKAGADSRIQVVDNLADISVGKDAAAPLGLIVNEVLTNSFKHAFPDGRNGIISVILEASSDNSARLLIKDDGVGFDANARTKGIGQKLVTGFVKQLNGTFSVTSTPEGSQFTLDFPRSSRGE